MQPGRAPLARHDDGDSAESRVLMFVLRGLRPVRGVSGGGSPADSARPPQLCAMMFAIAGLEYAQSHR